MRKLILLISSVLLLASCQEKDSVNLSFSDKALEGTKAYLYLEEDSTNIFAVADSVEIKAGKLSFDLSAPQDTAIAYVYVPAIRDEKKQKIYFIREKGQVNISVEEDGKTEILKGKLNLDYQSFKNRITDIRSEMMADLKNEQKADSLMTLQDRVTFDYYKPLMKTALGEYLYVTDSKGLTTESSRELLKYALPDFKEIIKIWSKPLLLQETMVGEKFVDIKGISPEGKRVALSNYVGKGKIVLVEFWASWCPPCRRDMPFIASLYEEFKDKGLEIVGVSLDTDKKTWTDYLKKANMTWMQISDLKEWDDSPAITDYNIQSIPYTVLVDREGIIQSEYLSGLDLEDKIKELLDDQKE